MKKFVALLLALAMVLSLAACGSGSSTTSAADGSGEAAASGNAISDLVSYETTAREIETLNILYSQSGQDLEVLANLQDGLLTNDSQGNLIGCLAETWETTDGGLTWTFHLRNDATWSDNKGNVMGNVTAQDFVTGLEWVLNYYKNESYNTSMPMETIAGAEDYFNMTMEMSEEEALALTVDDFTAMVGIEAVDDYTLKYTCVAALPYFETITTYNCLYAAPAALIDQLGVEGFRACTIDNMWYNGPYVLTEYIQGNEKIFEPNPNWWGDSTNTRFNSITIKIIDSVDTAYTLYQSGDIDNVTLSESNLTTIANNTSSEYYNYLTEYRKTKYSYQFHFCYDKNNEDGTPDVNWNTAIANEAFRLAWYYGLDLTSFYSRTNAINPLKTENNYYTMTNLCFKSDGTDYTDLVKQRLGLGDYNGETMVRYDSAKFEEYKAQAIEELTAQGVTFPIEVDYYIVSGNQTALDSATVLKQAFSDSFGDDFMTLNICTYINSLSQEVRTPRLASFYINGWGADYGDPKNYLGQETLGDENAYYSAVYSCINDFVGEDASEPYSEELIATYEEYTELVDKANAIVDDMDARYEAFADAEAYLIQHALVVPCYYDIGWQLTNINDYSKIYCAYGIQFYRYLNWETNSEGYTTADYDAFAAAAEG